MLVLAIAPRPQGVIPALSLEHVESIFAAVESQSEDVRVEWLWPPNAAALRARLAGVSDTPDVVYIDGLIRHGSGGLELLFAGDAGEQQAVSLADTLGELSDAATRLVLLRLEPERGAEVDVSSEIAEMIGDSPAVVLLRDNVSAELAQSVMAEALASLATGSTIADALELANKLRAGDEPLQFVGGTRAAGLTAGVAGEPQEPAKIIAFPGRDLAPAWQRLPQFPAPGALPEEPAAGFVGRGHELQRLEAMLRDEQALDAVWVHGYAGVGKTALVAHLARWLVRTGRFEHVVYTDWTGGGFPEQALLALGAHICGPEFQLGGDSVATIAQALAEKPTLIVWDNVGQILSKGMTPIPAEPLAELMALAEQFAHIGGSRLVIVSDTPEMPDRADRVLAGVRPIAVSALCPGDTVDLLVARGLERGAELQALVERLIGTIGGHPLAIGALATLAEDSSFGAVLDSMQQAYPALADGEALLRNQAQDLAIDRLMQSLPEETRQALYGMGLYAGGFMQALAIKNLGLEQDWASVAPPLQKAGLISLRELPGFSVPYVQLHPSMEAYVDRHLSVKRRADSEQEAAQGYLGLLHWVQSLDSHMAIMGRLLALRELPNFRRSLNVLMRSDDLNTAMTYARYYARLLTALHLTTEQASVAKTVERTAASAMPAEGPLARPGVQLILGQVSRLSSGGRVGDAGALLQQLCARMSAEDGLSYSGEEAERDRGVAFAQLGHFMRVAAKPKEAMAAYQQALAHFGKAGITDDVRRQLVALFEGIGQTMAAVGQWKGAEESYLKGMEAATQVGDRLMIGNLSTQLATVAAASSRPDLARERLESALGHYQALDDHVRSSSTWSQLASLAQAQGDGDEAVRCLREALRFAEQAENPAMQAQLHLQLGAAAAQTGALDEAEMRYSQAIAISDQGKLRPSLVVAQRSLAGLLLQRGRHQEARIQAEAARASAEPLGPAARPWETHLLLMRIADEEGDQQESLRWRMVAQEAFAKSRDAEAIRTQWQVLISSVATSCRGEAISIEAVSAVEQLEESEQWGALATVIWRVLGGERGQDVLAGLDLVDAVIVRAILDAIEAPEPADSSDDEPTD